MRGREKEEEEVRVDMAERRGEQGGVGPGDARGMKEGTFVRVWLVDGEGPRRREGAMYDVSENRRIYTTPPHIPPCNVRVHIQQ